MTLGLFVVLYVFGLLGIAAVLAWWARPERRAPHVFVAGALGLEFAPTRGHTELRGFRNGVLVRVAYLRKGSGNSKLPITRIVASGVSPEVRLAPETLATGVLEALGRKDYRTGDARFDDQVVVGGDPALLRALLDAETRDLVRRAVYMEHACIADGEVSLERNTHLSDPAVVEALIARTVTLAQRLADPGRAGLSERLAHTVRTDPEPEVRLRCLLALEAAHSGPSAAAAAQAALTDDDPRVRLLAARILGDVEQLRIAPVDALHGLAPYEPDPLARALAKARAPAQLVALLDLSDPNVRIAALGALARVGTADHVAALLPLTRGLLGNDAVRSAARDAVAAIQARVGADAAGRITLLEGEAGAVSLAPEPGRVSLPEEGRS